MFEQYAPTSLDTPKQLEDLYGLTPPSRDLGFVCGGVCIGAAALASGSAVAYINSLLDRGWDTGTYNTLMQMMNNTIGGGIPGKPGGWDQFGWESGCWQKYPGKRKEWLAYWGAFSKHYAKYGEQSGYLSDAAENPVRNILLPKLRMWASWFEKTCGKKDAAGQLPQPLPNGGGPLDPITSNGDTSANIATMVKWGALGIGGILLLNVVSGIRGAFPRRQPQ